MKTSNKILGIIVALLGGAILGGGVFYEMTLKSGSNMMRVIGVEDTGHLRTISQKNLNLQHVKISGPFQVVLKPGEVNSVSVSADEAVLQQVVMEPGTLGFHVKFKSNRAFVSNTPARVEITSNAVQRLTLNGGRLSLDAQDLKQKMLVFEAGGDVSGVLSGEVEQFVMNAGGRGKFKLQDLQSDGITLSMTGGTDVVASGKVKKLIIAGTGAPTIDTTRLIARDVTVVVRGATNVKLYAKETLSMMARGASTIKYLGHPKILKEDVKGASHVEALD
jgi:hypothetical protein